MKAFSGVKEVVFAVFLLRLEGRAGEKQPSFWKIGAFTVPSVSLNEEECPVHLNRRRISFRHSPLTEWLLILLRSSL